MTNDLKQLINQANLQGYQAPDHDRKKSQLEMSPSLRAKQTETKRVKKILDLYAGNDQKYDRDSDIKRVGTPVSKMLSSDLPSPVAVKNSKN